jgi:hypothetical protein
MAKSSMKSTIRRASKSRTAWIVGIAAAATAVGAAVYFGEKSAKATSGATPSPAVGPAPAGSTPIWSQLTPVSSQVNGVNTYMVVIPQGSTFAFADSGSDVNLTQIVNGLNNAVGNGTITGSQAFTQGTAPPAWWPTGDTFGTAGYRVTGVASSALSLSLGPLSSYSPATTPMVWVVTGWT